MNSVSWRNAALTWALQLFDKIKMKFAIMADIHANLDSLTLQNTPVCFFGHTHVPVAFVRDNALVRGGTFTKFK